MAENAPTRSTTSVQLSAKMMESQASLQKVVKQELQVLIESGYGREVAVKILLHRIVESTKEPDESDVRRAMKQFQMNYDDAMHALIVKQEIGRLKEQGLDSFAAIEVLTRRMQQISIPTPSVETGDIVVDAKEDAPITPEDVITGSDAAAKGRDDRMMDQEIISSAGDRRIEVMRDEPSTTLEPTQSSDGGQSTLCEQIDQFSISASTNSTPSPSLATTNPSESSRSAFSFFSNHSRKRRVTSGDASPTTQDYTGPIEAPRSAHVSAFHRPLSPTFRFPKTKKQKLWTEDIIDDTPVYEDDDDGDSTPPPASPTTVSTRGETPTSSNAPTPTKIGKRRRTIHGPASPELDDTDVAEALVRVTKRHKM